MKKILSIVLSAIMLIGVIPAFPAAAAEGDPTAAPSFNAVNALYVHAVVGSDDTQAWQAWQSVHDMDFNVANNQEKYFFLPSSASDTQVDIYNAFNTGVTVNGVAIPSKQTATVSYNTTNSYPVNVNGTHYSLRFMKSHAEAAIYINNTNIEGNASGVGTYLMDYLTADKSRSAKADGAIVSPDGTIDNTTIKKIKGRGNTTWNNVSKKPFNITYNSKVSIGGMPKGKKYSILANFQDDSLSRNRILYDLGDEVNIPYASDSRYVDFYSNGFYWGSYQMTQKVEVGSSELVPDFDEDDYLNADDTVKEDFPFLCEVDASAKEGEDYFVTCSDNLKITIKAPELEVGDPGYDEVKNYVRDRFNRFYATTTQNGDISQYGDVDSLTKLYFINELGKNWDSGASSMYLVHKQDADGNYKFFGSPVWDYDNSLGNAVGVGGDLSNMGVTDYTLPTGWWCKYKGKSRNSNYTNNVMNRICRNEQIIEASPRIWFECFLPAVNHFTGKVPSAAINKELYQASDYLTLIEDSANMNYTSGWAIKTSDWVADHTMLKRAEFNDYTGVYTEYENKYYPNTFSGVFNYAADWLNYRAAWLSKQYYSSYVPSHEPGDVNRNGTLDIGDVTEIQKHLADLETLDFEQYKIADYNRDKVVNINDATLIQLVLAELADPPTDVPEEEYNVLFTNSLGWEGTIYCYCWYSDTGTPIVNWPGSPMTYVGKNEYDQDQYKFPVPEGIDRVIFTNNAEQTANIPLDRTVTGYYALEDTEPITGRHLWATWTVTPE
ncbi:MAG: CotH kinase family protein [Ruminococcus sp.]|nr:CotH kinase family protein [Ruminococcus sp.]